MGPEGLVNVGDFNPMLEVPLGGGAAAAPRTSAEMQAHGTEGLPIAWGSHCFGCSAGQGSSCAGATV